jgi:predicted ATP-grasp superfamily ATP-dependent carboligase
MMGMTSTVLITNYNYKNSLAAVRDIGSKGINVHTCGPQTRNKVASLSKYSSGYSLYTSPNDNVNRFIIDIRRILSTREYEMIIPIGIDTTIPISHNKEELSEYTRVPVADYEILENAHDKYKTIKIAKSVGVPVPETSIISGESIEEKSFEYPLVIKARKGAAGSGTRYITSEDDFSKVVREFNQKKSDGIFDYERPMVQEYIPGDLMDVCVLFNRGRPRAALAQRRVITYPPSGGVGIVNETVEDPELIELALKLLKRMNWHGVAQVEFKKDGNGEPRLMEINPKFWGTLELSIAAGLNFPYMLYRMTMDGDIEPNFNYERNLQIWWSFAHLQQIFLAYIKNRNGISSALKTSNIRRISDLSLLDLKPHIFQLVVSAVKLFQFKQMLSHPLSR